MHTRRARLALAAMTNERFCTSCGASIRAAAKFCHRCGQPTDGSARTTVPAGAAGPGTSQVLPWAVAGIALLCLLAFIVGQNLGRPAAAPSAAPVAAASGRAPDISQMGPAERADRLFQRVMTYVAEGKSDSVAFFAPMAIQSQLALAPLDAHRRYDLGLLGMVSADGAMARAQADTILAENPDHLLGLILAMRAAGMTQDAPARDKHAKHLVEIADRERARALPEYVDHEPDITAALREAANPPSPSIRRP
jgi:zinc-ribbon domain